jgi:YD repeat-containing protein
MTDPGGHRVDWLYDEQGRTIARFSNGNLTSDYQYDSAGRLVATTDALNQTKLFTYNSDDTLADADYANASHPTPSVHWTWDQDRRRVLAMDDGTGSTTYTYVAAGALGAGQVASIVLPNPSHTIAFSYDSLGRVVQRSIDGTSVSLTYDALGRRTTIGSPLGNATVSYDGSSDRPTTVTFPNIQTRATYGSAALEFPLATIQTFIGPDSFGGFSYTWDAAGEQLIHATGFGANTDYQYDPSQRLVSASQYTDVLVPGSSPPATTYGFDLAGNRTSEIGPSTVTTSTYDAENRLIAVHRQLNQTTMAAIRKARKMRATVPRPGTRPARGER